jgi:hypothetical protein
VSEGALWLADLYGIQSLMPPFEPALDGRAGDSEEVLDLLSRDATVDGREHFQSEVLRVGVHGPIFVSVHYLRNPL